MLFCFVLLDTKVLLTKGTVYAEVLLYKYKKVS